MTKSEAYIATIMGILGSGVVERGKVLSKFVKKWQVSDRTFDRAWKIAQERHKETMHSVQKEVEATTIQQAKEDALNGIKTKNQRIKEKQADIDLIREAVKKGTTKDTIVHQGVPIEIDRPLTEIEKATMLKRAAEIESEISKIEGDYAAVKQDVKVDDLRTWKVVEK